MKVLLTALGFPDAQLSVPEQERLLNDVGVMIREMANGLIVLLSARKLVKAEFRMDETQVQPEENNPFKFHKVGELALDELLITRSGGFQQPDEATRSAFNDVKQHTLLTVSAMKRAIKLLLERLSPEALMQEEDDGANLRIRGLGGRKGKWESYVESHAKLSGNLDVIARQIIAEAFAQVHEELARKVSKEYWENKS